MSLISMTYESNYYVPELRLGIGLYLWFVRLPSCI